MNAGAAPSAKRVVVLGSTGSIGVNTLDVIDHLNRTSRQRFRVVGLAAGRNASLLSQQAVRFGVEAIALCEGKCNGIPGNATCYDGPDAALQLVENTDADLVVAAIVGAAGLPATLAAITRGTDVALANKETLVAAGSLVIPLAQKTGTKLLPVDSEHAAIWQCLLSSNQTSANQTSQVVPGIDTATVRRVVLTASGGPFRDTAPEDVYNATAEQALNHPTWDMGPKVTVDSATMMNKALELIEAHHLFQLPPEKLTALIHPQSVVHGLVEFADHSILAQLGPPDMRTPIQAALSHPDRPAGCSRQLDWTRLSRLDFTPPDGQRFPALDLAYRAIRAGGTAGAVLNAANEAAVDAFLKTRSPNPALPFGRIVELVAQAMDAIPATPADSLEAVLAADSEARAFVHEELAAAAASPR